MSVPTVQRQPFVVPTTDGKLIEEHFGGASIGGAEVSIAHMITPPRWSASHQNPAVDEYTLMVRGPKQVEADGKMVVLSAGESLLVRKRSQVRYANPFDAPVEYLSVCRPAFSPRTVNHEESSEE